MKLKSLHEATDSVNLKDHSYDNMIQKEIKDLYHIKDKKKSNNAKNQWKNHRNEMQKSIDDWHKSGEGKLFHRKLNRFNQTH